MSIEIIGLRFTHRKSINPSLYGPFFNYFGGGILRYYLHQIGIIGGTERIYHLKLLPEQLEILLLEIIS